MIRKIVLRPGIDKQRTQTLNMGGYSDGNLIRFRDGLAQSVGGWTKYAGGTFDGVCRGLHGWVELKGLLDVGVGTHKRLYVLQAGTFYDVTPLRKTTDPLGSDPFATTDLSPLVTVTDTDHGASVGDLVVFSGASAVAGLTLVGEYSIVTVPDDDTYTITAGSNANATATGGGASVVAEYVLPFGRADASYSYGYGIGPYGAGAYGTGQTTANLVNEPALWSINNWGEQMIACPINGGIYVWVPPTSPLTRAAVVSNAPLHNSTVIVGMPQQQIISLGCEAVSVYDPLLIRWTDAGDYTVWTATQTNLAGSYRIPRGSRIVGGLAGPQQIMVWTNEGLWLMQFIGLPFVYSFVQVGFGTPLIAQKAAAVGAGVTYWMGLSNFYVFDGTARVLPCSVWDFIFGRLNVLQHNKVFAAVNSLFNEIFWFFPSSGSIEIDSYVKYNWVDQAWDVGTLSRTAWEDKIMADFPLAASSDGYVYAHESTTEADGALIPSSVTTGYADIAEGEDRVFCDRIIPDFAVFSGEVEISIYLLDQPGGTPRVKGPYTVTPSTEFITFRGRGRQIALKIDSKTLGTTWRMGALRLNAQPDGRR